MNLLIVDDDLHVIEGIERNLDWERLHIHQAFQALGVPVAKKVLSSNPIDVMICDIEMPQETGLDLLEWIREEGFPIQAIFLTSYAKFEYAQRAIKLESLEYILKPVEYGQLEKAVVLAVERSLKSRQNEAFKESSRYWEQNRQNVVEYFWTGVLARDASSDEEELNCKIEECGLDYIRGKVFLPIVIQMVRDVAESYAGLADAVDALCTKCLEDNTEDGVEAYEFHTKISDHTYFLMLRARMNSDPDVLRRDVERFMDFFMEEMGKAELNVLCGVGMWSTANLVYEDVSCIYTMMYESPRNKKKVLYLQEYEPVSMMYEVPDLKNWWDMMKYGQTGELKEAVERYLDILAGQQKLSSRNLQQLGLDLTQMVYSWLGSMNIYAHMLFDNEENNKIYGRAALSSHNMIQYLEYLLSKAMEYKDVVERPHTIVDTIRDYMDHHFQENLSRDDLSRLVFLNPDYLSRLFKKEMGLSISSYLIQKRIDLAKDLLSTTRTPVSVISSQAGYDNFAYFTKVFKEKTGMSPNEYRKNCQSADRRDKK